MTSSAPAALAIAAFSSRTGSAVDGCAEHLRHLHQQASGTTGCGMDQALVARLQREGGVREIVGGHALQHRGGGGIEIHAGCRWFTSCATGTTVYSAYEPRNMRIGDAVAGFEVRDACADGFHRSRAFIAGGERKIGFVKPGAEVDVDEIDAGGGDLDQCLAGAGRGYRGVHQLQFFGTAGFEIWISFMPFGLECEPQRAPRMRGECIQ